MIGRLLRWIASLFGRAPIAITHGAYVFCGWANPRPEFGQVPGVQCPVANPWIRMEDRVPALGQYDERDPAITAKRLEWMQQGRIDYACYQVEWRHDTHQLLMAHCADNHLSGSPIKFCTSFFDVLAGSSDSYLPMMTPIPIAESIRAYACAVAQYMMQSNYLRVDGRPVLFRGYPDNLRFYQRFGFLPQDVINLVRAEIGPLYLVATCVDPSYFPLLKRWGFDAYTEYLLSSIEGWNGVLTAYRDRWAHSIDICKQTGIDYWVPAMCGYDARAQGIANPVTMPTPAEFTAHLKEARQFARDNAKYTRGQVITYALTEFREGGILEPMAPGMIRTGDEMLRAHAAAVT